MITPIALHASLIMPTSEMLLPDVYCGELLNLMNGYPLFEPDPGDETHVQVGDVGYIDRSMGHFHRLFNAFFDESSPINAVHGVPEHFTPLPDDLRSTYLRAPLPIGVHSSKKVSTIHLDFDVQGYRPFTHMIHGSLMILDRPTIPIGANIQLACSSQRGAVLIIKEPAQRVESKKSKKLGKELQNHYQAWHAFLCDTFGEDISLREMIFVTGCDLTSDWATATFFDRVASGTLNFKVCDLQTISASATAWGKWESATSVPVRCGPSVEQKDCHIECEHKYCQCVFVRGWRVSKRIKPLPPKLKAAAEPEDNDPSADGDSDYMLSLARIDEAPSDSSDEDGKILEGVFSSSCLMKLFKLTLSSSWCMQLQVPINTTQCMTKCLICFMMSVAKEVQITFPLTQ